MTKNGECEILQEDVPVPDVLFKSILIGDAGVGKTCMLYRAINNEFKEAYDVTIGAEFSSLTVRIASRTVKMQIWDTAGQENFRSMIRVFYKGSHAAFLVYDVTRKDSFEKLEEWLIDVRENANPDVRVMLVGNQKDNESKREVSTEHGAEFAKAHQFLGFRETSAKTGDGITELFVDMIKTLHAEQSKAPKPAPRKGKKLAKQKIEPKTKKGCC